MARDPEPARRRRRVLFHIGLSTFVVACTAVVLLLSLALLDTLYAGYVLRYPEDPQRRNFVRKGSHWVSESPRMIDVAFPAEKTPATFRVFLLGGSQAMGSPYVHQRFSDPLTRLLGLSNEGGISSWLRRYLEELLPARTVEVVNAARGGGSLGDSLPLFEEILEIGEPDLVIFLSGNNERQLGDAPTFEQVLDRVTRSYRDQVQTVVRRAQERSANLYFLTVPTNIRDWLPHAPSAESIPGLERYLPPEQWIEIGAQLESENAGTPADALVLFARAKRADLAGDIAAAKELYIRAKDLDRQFVRARSQWNDIVRGIDSPNVRVLDLEEIVYGYAEDGIPGYDLFHDNCHFRLSANNIAAYEIARDIARRMELDREPVFLADIESIGITENELRRLYLAKTLKWIKMQYYGGLSAVMGVNAGEVAQRYHSEDEGMRAILHKISAAAEAPASPAR